MQENEYKTTELEELVASQLKVLYPEQDSYGVRIRAAHGLVHTIKNHIPSDAAAKAKIKLAEFEALTRPLIQWLNENYDPPTSITITPDSAEVMQGLMIFPCNEYIKD
jgi:hypothetical protein